MQPCSNSGSPYRLSALDSFLAGRGDSSPLAHPFGYPAAALGLPLPRLPPDYFSFHSWNLADRLSGMSEQLGLLPRKQRRSRTAFTHQQLAALEGTFAKAQYPDVVTRERLALCTSLPEARIQAYRRGPMGNLLNHNMECRKQRLYKQISLSLCGKPVTMYKHDADGNNCFTDVYVVWFKNRRAKFRKKMKLQNKDVEKGSSEGIRDDTVYPVAKTTVSSSCGSNTSCSKMQSTGDKAAGQSMHKTSDLLVKQPHGTADVKPQLDSNTIKPMPTDANSIPNDKKAAITDIRDKRQVEDHEDVLTAEAAMETSLRLALSSREDFNHKLSLMMDTGDVSKITKNKSFTPPRTTSGLPTWSPWMPVQQLYQPSPDSMTVLHHRQDSNSDSLPRCPLNSVSSPPGAWNVYPMIVTKLPPQLADLHPLMSGGLSSNMAVSSAPSTSPSSPSTSTVTSSIRLDYPYNKQKIIHEDIENNGLS